jgi:Ca-activated chloride channel family protein
MRILAYAGAFVLGLMAPVHAQPRPDRLEALMIASSNGGRELSLAEAHLQVAIDGQHASTTLRQTYRNGPARIEGQYRLRPGSGSHVDGFAYWNGETKIVGEVFERQTAHEVYNRVTARKRDPGLLEEDGEGAFSFKVFPIEPNEQKRVELRWTSWLPRHGRVVHYHAPLTRADADVVVTLAGPAKNLRSPNHRMHLERLAAGGVRLRSDGDAVIGELDLEWDVDEPDWTPSAYVQPGGPAGDGWFALSLAAPARPSTAIVPKDVTIVIDRSGSMQGDPMRHAQAAAQDMIRLLNPGDRVNVIAFSDEVDPFFASPQVADTETRARAMHFVERLHAGGGTDIALALSTAIQSQDAKSGRTRVIVFMTDGQSDGEKSIAAAKTDTGDVRLFTLGLGKDVNRPLLQRLAALKRGRFAYIADAGAIEPEVARLASHIAKPLLVDVSVEVQGAQAVKLYPRTLPDLFAEDELLVSGRVRGGGTAKFIIRGKLDGKPVTFTRDVALASAPKRPWVGALWAQSRVEHLQEELALNAAQPELKNEILELALAYNFVTPYTAFLAVPESELGEMRGTVEQARAHKAKIMADNPDAADLDGDRNTRRDVAQKLKLRSRDVDSSLDDARPSRKRAFSDDDDDAKSSKRAQFEKDRFYADSADAPRTREARTAERDDEPIAATGTADKRHGCAGCASGGSAGWLAAAVLVLIVRRRRRM